MLRLFLYCSLNFLIPLLIGNPLTHIHSPFSSELTSAIISSPSNNSIVSFGSDFPAITTSPFLEILTISNVNKEAL